jgi:hypothetical protein
MYIYIYHIQVDERPILSGDQQPSRNTVPNPYPIGLFNISIIQSQAVVPLYLDIVHWPGFQRREAFGLYPCCPSTFPERKDPWARPVINCAEYRACFCRGRYPFHGSSFTFKDPTNWWETAPHFEIENTNLNKLRIRFWNNLHFRKARGYQR